MRLGEFSRGPDLPWPMAQHCVTKVDETRYIFVVQLVLALNQHYNNQIITKFVFYLQEKLCKSMDHNWLFVRCPFV